MSDLICGQCPTCGWVHVMCSAAEAQRDRPIPADASAKRSRCTRCGASTETFMVLAPDEADAITPKGGTNPGVLASDAWLARARSRASRHVMDWIRDHHGELRRVGRRAIAAAHRAGIPAYYVEDGRIVRHWPDGHREVVTVAFDGTVTAAVPLPAHTEDRVIEGGSREGR